jgi:hypothetical protein
MRWHIAARRGEHEPRHPQRLQPAQRVLAERDVAAVPAHERDLDQGARLRREEREDDEAEPVDRRAHRQRGADAQSAIGRAAPARAADQPGGEADHDTQHRAADEQRNVDGQAVEDDVAQRLLKRRRVAEALMQEGVRQVARQLLGLLPHRDPVVQRAEDHEGQRGRDQDDGDDREQPTTRVGRERCPATRQAGDARSARLTIA